MRHRQAKLPLASPIFAAGCIVVWMAGISACDLEALFCCESQGSEMVVPADLQHSHDMPQAVAGTNGPHDADTHHCGETDGHPHHAPMPGSKEGSCCSTLKAVAQTSTSAVCGRPAPRAVAVLCVVPVTPDRFLAILKGPLDRHAKSCARILTPEVCLGPAHRSLAPPALRLI